MGDHRQSLLHSSEAEGRPHWGQDSDARDVQGAGSSSGGTEAPTYLGDEELRFEDQEEETLPEEVTGEELPGPRAPEEALAQLERVLEKDAEEDIPEMRWACSGGRDSGGSAAAPPWPHVPLPRPGGGPGGQTPANTALSRWWVG